MKAVKTRCGHIVLKLAPDEAKRLRTICGNIGWHKGTNKWHIDLNHLAPEQASPHRETCSDVYHALDHNQGE